MGQLDGRVALITGAARGMGRSHALRLAEEGADIVAVDICRQIDQVAVPLSTPDDLVQTASMIEGLGRRVVTAIADVRDRPGLRSAVEAGVEQFGRLDVVVANAGIWAVRLDQPLDDEGRLEIWNVTLDVNLTGVWNTIEVATPFVVAGGRGGSIIVISSTAAMQTVSNDDVAFTSYSVSKWGLIGLMKMSASDLAKYDIRVNAVHPSGVDTPLTLSDVVRGYWDSHAELAAHASRVYQTVEERDVSDAVLYLASDASRAVSGISLPIDAGSMVRWR
jgi:SDR family mycofactocin-dependent oxidoreductase